VVMTLPRQEPDEAASGEQETAAAGVASAPVTGTILLVDDDDNVRVALADMLEARGHVVQQAASGVEALAMFKGQLFDLLLLDFAMPGMTGADVARQALEHKPDLRLLFITGHSDSDAIDQAVAGNARVLKKPIGAADLATAVEQMLSAPRTPPAPPPASARRSAR
jgi:CheY-like chemotaxis protein